MHAHNELAVLNRVQMFSMNDTAPPSDLINSAMTVQVWFFLQLLAGKLVETWNMISERFLQSHPRDAVLKKLEADQINSLSWLKDYFNGSSSKDRALRIIRDRTAFPCDKLNLSEAIDGLPAMERMIYVAQHPAHAHYFPGSALVFRAAFALIAAKADPTDVRTFAERTAEGVKMTIRDAEAANVHIHTLLYGLIRALLDDVLGHPLSDLTQTRIPIVGAPKPSIVRLPAFIDIGKRGTH
jgi:hypothetical protein